jgi:hypothetical protein
MSPIFSFIFSMALILSIASKIPSNLYSNCITGISICFSNVFYFKQ